MRAGPFTATLRWVINQRPSIGSEWRSKRTNGEANYANWDLSSHFPSFEGPEYLARLGSLAGSLAGFEKDALSLGVLSKENLEAWIEMFLRNEKIVVEYSHVSSYVGCLAAADAKEFFPRYENLLRITGSYPAEEAVERSTGIDLTAEAFWEEAIGSIADEVERFEAWAHD